MELKVYNGENFERSKKWFLIFAFVILLVVVLSILSNNIIGGIFVFIVAGGYIFYITKVNDTTKIIIGEQALQIGKLVYPYKSLKGFVLEYHTEKKKIHNIVILDNKNDYKIYTIKDTEKNLKNFVEELGGYIPMLETYERTTMDKFIRKLKL